jgi:hypothetical protein
MSEDEKGFLARWSQRKRDAGKADADAAAPEAPAQPGETTPEATASEAEPPFDLDSLPKLEELTSSTDMTVFFKKGVPESIRNAALRKSWVLDPAIRNYVNPALDYAYDWNTPGGVPGSGELAPGTDIARMVSQIMGTDPRQTETVDKRDTNEAYRRNESSDDVAKQQDEAPSPASVRLSETSTPPESQAVASLQQPQSDLDQPSDGSQNDDRDFASQQADRRHGSARPK